MYCTFEVPSAAVYSNSPRNLQTAVQTPLPDKSNEAVSFCIRDLWKPVYGDFLWGHSYTDAISYNG
jgi:hypothetical protein